MANRPLVAVLPRAQIRFVPVLLICTMLASCGGSGGGDATPAAAVADDGGALDLAIAQQAYSADRRTPDGFYAEPRLFPDRSEFRFHVKNTDVGIDPEAPVAFEVCSDDFAEALQWSAASADVRRFNTTLSATDETDWYFEFQRAVDSDEPAVLINRVFKCTALDRAGLAPDGYAGQVMRTPLTAEDLRFISEYFWQFSPYNNALHAVTDSVAAAAPDELLHDLRRAEIRTGAGSASGCDRVEVWTWRHSVGTGDGVLTSTQTYERGFDARRSNGVVSLCGR